MSTIYSKLSIVQQKLKIPKDQYNSFGHFRYRSLESILGALKPILQEVGLTMTLSDELIQIGERFYIKSTATLIDIDSGDSVMACAWAREEKEKKGMDSSQITGASSSYARKYAVGGLCAIDDTQDSDATNTGDPYKTAVSSMGTKAGTSTSKDNDVEAQEAQIKAWEAKGFPVHKK